MRKYESSKDFKLIQDTNKGIPLIVLIRNFLGQKK